MEMKETEIHVREHMSYPASKDQLIQACNMMSHVPEADRKWFEETLPEGTYNSADEVLGKLRL